MNFTFDDTDTLCVDTIRCLSMDAVEKANSGHPGAPMGLAPVAHVLFNKVMKISPDNPEWVDRDRFILSCGHASALLYSVLHLSGFDISLEDLKDFRQWGSKTAGHPEYEAALGIEMTTGPLGQGCATSVGFALAEAHLGARFNTPDQKIVDHMTWVLCGDGDLMEGITSEAASIAGHLGLGKLVWIWDDNRITIEGTTDISVSDDYPARFAAQGWHVLSVDDANDLAAVAYACDQARLVTDKPTLICVRSHIAYGAPHKQDTASAHGAPLGDEEIRAAKASYGVPVDKSFYIPESVTERYSGISTRGQQLYAAWQQEFSLWSKDQPADSEEWQRRMRGDRPENWCEALPVFEANEKGPATRAASGTVINAIAGQLPELIGGSADLSPSCKTTITTSGHISRGNYLERNLHFGIREHGMGSMINGMSLHGGPDPKKRRRLEYEISELPSLLQRHGKMAVLTDKTNGPVEIAKELLKPSAFSSQLSASKIYVCEKLGYDNEKITEGTPEEIVNKSFEYPNIVIVKKPEQVGAIHELPLPVFGLKEDEIEHSKGLITKNEVRAVTIHKLRLPQKGILWDIGAGSGSVSIEAARLCPELKVYAVEKSGEQLEHIKDNKGKFEISNIEIVRGEAPAVLQDLSVPDRVFIGGSGGNLEEIVKAAGLQISSGLVVINATTIETLNEAVQSLEKENFSVDVCEVSISRSKTVAQKKHMRALNPIFIVTGEKG